MSSSEESEYVVEAILDHTCKEGETYFLIKWEDYGIESNTWEPLENLNCPQLLKEYNQKIKETHKSIVPKKHLSRKSIIEPRKSKSVSSKSRDTSSDSSRETFAEIPRDTPKDTSSKQNLLYQPEQNLYETDDYPIPITPYQPREDEMVHEEYTMPFGQEEIFSLVDESDSDEYESEEEEEPDFDYSTCFIFPELTAPRKIISTALINKEEYYMIQFEDEHIYYITAEIAETKCEELVNKYHQKRAQNDIDFHEVFF